MGEVLLRKEYRPDRVNKNVKRNDVTDNRGVR